MASDTQKHSTQIHMQKHLPKSTRQKQELIVKFNPKNLCQEKQEPDVRYMYCIKFYQLYKDKVGIEIKFA